MLLELHVWGPAFSLPSIDPQCLAAIAYLSQAITCEQWILIASSDASCSPTKELPALRDNGSVVGGFENIVRHLRERSIDWDLDHTFLDGQDRADITAFSSHLHAHLLPLLLLSLYVSSENYTTTTRPAYTHILPWPTQFFIPPQHHSLAKTRTDHLNLSSLDLDHSEDEDRQRRKLVDALPAALRAEKRTVVGEVKRKGGEKRFKLDALVDVACRPIDQLLGSKRYLLSDERPTSSDCLALGYLALALKPDVPQQWLQEGLRDRYPSLCTYVERGIEECFGRKVNVEDALLDTTARMSLTPTSSNEVLSPPAAPDTDFPPTLPWHPPRQSTIPAAVPTILHSIKDALPLNPTTTVHAASSADDSTPPTKFQPPTSSSVLTATSTLTTLAALTASVASYALYTFLAASHQPDKKRLEDMGEAGAMLAGIDFGPPPLEREAEQERREHRDSVPVGLQVRVEGDVDNQGRGREL